MTFNDMVQKQRAKNIKKDLSITYFSNGMEVKEEIPEPMSRITAEENCLQLIGRYTDEDQITALFTIIADGDEGKYKELWIEYLSRDG